MLAQATKPTAVRRDCCRCRHTPDEGSLNIVETGDPDADRFYPSRARSSGSISKAFVEMEGIKEVWKGENIVGIDGMTVCRATVVVAVPETTRLLAVLLNRAGPSAAYG